MTEGMLGHRMDGCDPARVLRDVFGIASYRPLQEAVIGHVTGGGDGIVLMPTGGGKSLCFQLPALCRSGTGLIISPLIALMHDQVAGLRAKGVRAGLLSSGQSPEEMAACFQALETGGLDLLYVSPERAVTPRFLHTARQARLSLIAVDEAHCISQWGHDFRPSYRGLDRLLRLRPDVPRLALTGTADHKTLRDIKHYLWLDEARVFKTSFARPNIALRVIPGGGRAAAQADRILSAYGPGPAIFYCRSRKKTEQVAAALSRAGVDALAYHAGLEASHRRAVEERFLTAPAPVIAATVAFGMGLSRADVRLIAHLDLPDSLEAYWQEIGRAGRDGAPAHAVLPYGLAELIALRRRVARREGPPTPGASERLDAMIAYCETVRCRSQEVLAHFGESETAPCGQCDVCRTPVERTEASGPARAILEILAAAGHPMGPSRIIETLRTDNPAMNRSVLRQLVAKGLLQPADTLTSALEISGPGYQALKTGAQITMRREWPLPHTAEDPPCTNDAPTALAVLKRIRADLAAQAGLPAYLVCHDRALHAMAEARPGSLDALKTLPGMGSGRAARFGRAFLEALENVA